MALSADDDVAAAVFKRYSAIDGLVALVPGGLERGRCTSFQPNAAPGDHPSHEDEILRRRGVPYGTFEVTKGDGAQHNTGSWFIDVRLVRMEFRGKESAVRTILEYIVTQQVFNRQTLETASPFMACLIVEDQDMKKDAATKGGEDVWIGTYAFSVWTSRPE
jgi:hypothetical protein